MDELKDCEYIVPGLYYCAQYDFYVECWTDVEGVEVCRVLEDEDEVSRLIEYYLYGDDEEEEEEW